MAGTDDRPRESDNEDALKELGHPRGTLAIVLIFGVLFLFGWLAMYVFMFLQRGALHLH